MIDFKKIHSYSFQEIFDETIKYARTMEKKAMSQLGSCKYRAPDGNKCFIGNMIKDEDYSEKCENHSVTNGYFWEALNLVDYWRSLPVDLLRFLSNLQAIHDDYEAENWPEAFAELRQKYNLI